MLDLFFLNILSLCLQRFHLFFMRIVANSKPAAEIKWYRGHVELRAADNRHDFVIPLDNKRFTVSSNLTIKASANDDLIDYTCR